MLLSETSARVEKRKLRGRRNDRKYRKKLLITETSEQTEKKRGSKTEAQRLR